jgi:hypothetical protein
MDDEKFFGKILPLRMQEAVSLQCNAALLANQKEDAGLIGFLFLRPNGSSNSKNLFESLSYFNLRSAQTINFYIAGLIPEEDSTSYLSSELRNVPEFSNKKWLFSEAEFIKSTRHFQSILRWEYGGNINLIILSYKIKDKAILLDYGNAFEVDIEKAVENGAITNISSFFERIISDVENASNKITAHELASNLFMRQTKKSLFHFILKYFSKAFYEELIKINVFVPVDLNQVNTDEDE